MLVPKPILVTGAHRSGSTWIGRVLENSPETRYVHEPFNVGIIRPNSPLKFWNECITDDTNKAKQIEVLEYVKYFYGLPQSYLKEEFAKVHSYKEFRDFIWICRQRLNHRTVLKDPIAIFSAEWLHKTTGCDVILSIRHPAAFVASLIAKNWEFDFNNFIQQDKLMKTYLSEYTDSISRYAENRPDIISQGILLWNCIYSVVHQYQEKFDNKWIFIRHEDISLEPEKTFQQIFNKIGLTYSEEVSTFIKKTTQSESESLIERNSKKNIETWKQRLKPEDIEKIKEHTRKVWVDFYTEENWK